MSSKLLMDESPLCLQPSLAETIGLNEAIFLQQCHYWLNPNHNKNYKKGRYWVHKTLVQWQKEFPFWGEKTIRRIISNLEDNQIILSEVHSNGFTKSKFYSIDYDVLNTKTVVSNHHIKKSNASGQSDQIDVPKRADAKNNDYPIMTDYNGVIADSDCNDKSEQSNASGQSDQIDMPKRADAYGQNDQFHVVNMTRSYKDNKITSETTLSQNNSLNGHGESYEFVKPSSVREMILNLVNLWNEFIPSLAVNHITKSLSQDLHTIFTTVLGSDVSKWKTVCQNFQSSKFLMGEAEGVRIKPSLSWLVNPHKNHVEHVLFKSHFTFDDRSSVRTADQISESLQKEIDEQEPHAELRKLRQALCDQDYKVYGSYIKPAEFRLTGQTLEILPFTSKAREYLTSEWAQVMNRIVCEQFGYQLTIL